MRNEPRVAVDINVGNLTKWLRVMGYDTLFPKEIDDNGLVRIALRDGRILVTRDSGFARRRAVRLGQLQVVEISGDDLDGQLRQLALELDLGLQGIFSRCVLCNELLAKVLREDVAGRLPPYVHRTQRNFRECPNCLRLYWQGTHWSNMVSTLTRVREEGD